MAQDAAELVMIYNADGGLFSALSDAVHKIVSPSTYPCSLCRLTYGSVAMRDRWRRYLERVPFETRFLHRNELPPEWDHAAFDLPAIVLARPGAAPRVVVGKPALDDCEDLDALIALVDARLASTRSGEGDQPQ